MQATLSGPFPTCEIHAGSNRYFCHALALLNFVLHITATTTTTKVVTKWPHQFFLSAHLWHQQFSKQETLLLHLYRCNDLFTLRNITLPLSDHKTCTKTGKFSPYLINSYATKMYGGVLVQLYWILTFRIDRGEQSALLLDTQLLSTVEWNIRTRPFLDTVEKTQFPVFNQTTFAWSCNLWLSHNTDLAIPALLSYNFLT